MGNIAVAIKRFLANKNTVSIIGMIAGFAVIYFAYNSRVNTAVDPVDVPIASQTIVGNTRVEAEMIGRVRINRAASRTRNLITDRNHIINRYVVANATIHEGSFFYTGQLVAERQQPELIQILEPGYVLFRMSVDLPRTYGNSIMPGDVIDIFLQANRANERDLFGQWIRGIQVVGVIDAGGRDVFSSASTGRPTDLVFVVDYRMHLLLEGAQSIRGVTLHAIPRGRDYTLNQENVAPQMVNHYIYRWVINRTELIQDDDDLVTIGN